MPLRGQPESVRSSFLRRRVRHTAIYTAAGTVGSDRRKQHAGARRRDPRGVIAAQPPILGLKLIAKVEHMATRLRTVVDALPHVADVADKICIVLEQSHRLPGGCDNLQSVAKGEPVAFEALLHATTRALIVGAGNKYRRHPRGRKATSSHLCRTAIETRQARRDDESRPGGQLRSRQ